MPIFEYECDKCKKIFELLVRNNEDVQKCPECGGKKITKLVSSFSASNSSANECPAGGHCHDNSAKHHCCGGGCHCGH